MGKRWKRLWRDRSGEGYVDMVVLVLCGMLVLALCVQVLPVFVKKQQLDVFATELVREAEISGRVGAETDRRVTAAPLRFLLMSQKFSQSIWAASEMAFPAKKPRFPSAQRIPAVLIITMLFLL